MPKVITLPDHIEFKADFTTTILNAGLEQKLNLPHGCKDGKCGACKCKVISGEISLDPFNSLVLSKEEMQAGYTLLCKAHAKSDVVLEVPNLLNNFPIRILPSKVENIKKINNTAIITLKLPITQPFNFFAGQYIDILLQGKNRSYSIASSSKHPNFIELHVKYYPGGVFSEFVWHELNLQQILRFRGPLGTFKLHATKNAIIFVCTGTGFAPIKSMIEDMLSKQEQRKIYLYWGNRTQEDFYLLELIKKWQQQLDLTVTLCLSQKAAVGYAQGYVTQALSNDFINLANYDLYACGNLTMIKDVYDLATGKLSLAKENFFSDAFTPSV